MTFLVLLAAAIAAVVLSVLVLGFRRRPTPPAGGSPPRFHVCGTLVNAASGYPLPGIHIRVLASAGGAARASLGEAASDGAGHFALEGTGATELVLEVGEAGKAPWVTSALVRADGGWVRVAVPLPAAPLPDDLWREAGTRLREARIARVGQVARELIAPRPAGSPFAGWDAPLRHALLTQLEQAFLDPRGVLAAHAGPPGFHTLRTASARAAYRAKLQSYLSNADVAAAVAELDAKLRTFPDLTGVDWPVDPLQLNELDLGAAVTGFQEFNQTKPVDLGIFAGDIVLAPLPPEPPTPPTPEGPADPLELVGYRDYLLAIFQNHGNIGRDPIEAMELLERRFKQDFHTTDVNGYVANELAAGIVYRALTAVNDFGFDLPAAAVEPRGGRSAWAYLQYLVSLSGLSPVEFGLRYRLDLLRSDAAITSPVRQNVETLQNFYSDAYESPEEPFPIIPPGHRGHVPFYLEYEEWLRAEAPFHPENFYPLKEMFTGEYAPWLKKALDGAGEGTSRKWYQMVFTLAVEMGLANAAFRKGQYAVARSRYASARGLAEWMRNGYWNEIEVVSPWGHVNLGEEFTPDKIKARYEQRQGYAIGSMADLREFQGAYGVVAKASTADPPKLPWEDWPPGVVERFQFAAIHLVDMVFPACSGDLALAQGDYRAAVEEYGKVTGFAVFAATAADEAGYESDVTLKGYTGGDLPYSSPALYAPAGIGALAHPVELAWFRLRQGTAILEWADSLYRTGQPDSVSRARELYKAALWLHQVPPPVAPEWGSGPPVGFVPASPNPAWVAQVTRAAQGFAQIEMRLNWYGYRDDMVPTLRYRTLKTAADGYAAMARSAQHDFVAAVAQLEEASLEQIRTLGMLRKAELQVRLAGELAKVAQNNVVLALAQVEQVAGTIAAKKAEIEDHESLWGQFQDYVSGMGSLVDKGSSHKDKLPKDADQDILFAAGLKQPTAEQYVAGASKLGIAGGGATILAGFGVFWYASYTTLQSMSDADGARHGQLKALEKAQALAETQVHTRVLETGIAALQGQIAHSDVRLAHELLAFQQSRFLTDEFWSAVAGVMRRAMHRYLELGARHAWLAERALAYEQDRALGIIRFDYFPSRLEDVTGADLLQLDLAELEASRLAALERMIPIKHTVSLARDFPLAFAKLRKTGQCTFLTRAADFQTAYPGTYGHRIIGVTPRATSLDATPPPRGLLSNRGVSRVTGADGNGGHVSLRPRDALPVSEFRLENDMAVFGLPGEALMPFEGSGVETEWELEFPPAANPHALEAVADVLLTFDIRALYSAGLHATMPSAGAQASKLVLVSAANASPAALAALVGGDLKIADIVFDLASLGLPAHESGGTVTNLFVLVTGQAPSSFTATLAAGAGPTREIPFQDQRALSQAPPLAPSASPAVPLNAFVGASVKQTFRLSVDKAKAPAGGFAGVTDVVLGVEYVATLPA